jgi:hypothetical protein
MLATIGATALLMTLLLGPTPVESLDNPFNLTLEQDLDFIERDDFRVPALTTILQFFGPP